MEKKIDPDGVTKLLDKTLNKLDIHKDKDLIPAPKKKKSKIELAGERVMDHLMKLAEETDLSYSAMAKRINELYEMKLTKSDVFYFFKTNLNALVKASEEDLSLSKIRATLFLEHNKVLVKDIKLLDKEVEKLLDDDMIESEKRAKAVGYLLDKKGKLLIRHARLSGRLKDEHIDKKLEVNIYQQVNIEKSDLMNRLKKAEFKEDDIKPKEKKKIIDVEVE